MEELLKEITAENEEIVQIGRKYYLVNKKLREQSKIMNRRPEYLGIYLGEKKKFFQASPALVDLASKNKNNKSVITDKAEWMFLCGKDVFGENAEGKTEGTVFVQNKHDENLGYGTWTKTKGKRIIKNLIDKGKYLRQ